MKFDYNMDDDGIYALGQKWPDKPPGQFFDIYVYRQFKQDTLDILQQVYPAGGVNGVLASYFVFDPTGTDEVVSQPFVTGYRMLRGPLFLRNDLFNGFPIVGGFGFTQPIWTVDTSRPVGS